MLTAVVNVHADIDVWDERAAREVLQLSKDRLMAFPASHPVSALDVHCTLGSARGSFASELPMVLTVRAVLSSVPQPSAERLIAGRNSIADRKIARP